MSITATFMRTGILGIIVFAALAVIFIYPTFLYGGVDCIEGCFRAQGWPLAYRTVYSGASIDGQGGPEPAFDIVPLLADIAIWMGMSLVFLLATHRYQPLRSAVVVLLLLISYLVIR